MVARARRQKCLVVGAEHVGGTERGEWRGYRGEYWLVPCKLADWVQRTLSGGYRYGGF